MKIFLLILLVTILILFCPIPLKIKLNYINKKLEIYIYKKKLNLDKLNQKKELNKEKLEHKSTSKDEKVSKKLFSNIDVKSFIKNLINNRFKINLRFNCNLNYSFPDAAFTAIAFGYSHQLFVLIYGLLKLFFNVNDFKYDVNYEFNKNYINVEIEGIFFISFAKIIYICYLAIKSTKTDKKQVTNLHTVKEDI
ncbi:DUF2953 domain-containing protein [Clostridium ihumii]|uniref:DUF2953 domain-containing protein n=1 Tax=Clostridium ihumii TaxID=1470356 RepID=UPI00058B9282|nr:DUF2953 domain-containing protein [Clostridium ihumii]